MPNGAQVSSTACAPPFSKSFEDGKLTNGFSITYEEI